MAKYRVQNPATGEILETFESATDAQIEQAVAAADTVYREWREKSVQERANVVKRAAEIFAERREELARLIAVEMGKSIAESLDEVDFATDIIEYYAVHGPSLITSYEIPSTIPGKAVIEQLPVGVLLGVMPWNFPYYQVARFAAPNLVLGNTILLKHADICASSSLAMQQIFEEAGVPVGGYQNVFASHDQIAAMIADDRVQGVSLTGSERAGAIIGAQAGQHLKKCVLELGGSDVFLVLDTNDIDHAVAHAVGGRMENTGQACNGSKRIVVLDSVYDEFAPKFLAAISGQSLEEGNYGPMSSAKATEGLTAQVQGAIDQGAEVLVGNNTPNGNFYTPTVIGGVTASMDVYSQELFGPVAQLYKVSSDEEAITLANSSPYGLGSVVICDDLERAERVGNQLDVGMVFIGAAGLEGTDVPFGGVKKSGYGRELGKVGMLEFANKKLFRFAG